MSAACNTRKFSNKNLLQILSCITIGVCNIQCFHISCDRAYSNLQHIQTSKPTYNVLVRGGGQRLGVKM